MTGVRFESYKWGMRSLGEKSQRVVDLVHELDSLHAEKKKLTTSIDARIEKAVLELARVTGDKAMPHRESGSVPGHDSDEGTARRMVDVLTKLRGADFGILAAEVYGANNKETWKKARNLVYYLRKRGLARKIEGERGKWEIAIKTA